MGPIKLAFCVSFSSQCSHNPASNLLGPNGGHSKWLSDATDRSGKLEGVFQLERACKLTHIDIGCKWTFLAQILVGRSTWPHGRSFEMLVPGATFLSPTDCKRGNIKEVVRMFKYDDFCSGARDQEWDRIHIVLTQPFRKDVQYGISMLVIRSSEAEPGASNTSDSPSSIKAGQEADSPGRKSALEIQKHFFKRDGKVNKREERLKSQLGKIGASTEHGSQEGTLMSRTAKLVLAAACNTPNYKKTTAALVVTPPVRQRKPFTEEVREFLLSLEVDKMDMDRVTFADLRHRLEKSKCRKLSKEEKKVFLGLAQEFIDSYLEEKVMEERKNKADSQAAQVAARRKSEKEVAKEGLARSVNSKTFRTVVGAPREQTPNGAIKVNGTQAAGRSGSAGSKPDDCVGQICENSKNPRKKSTRNYIVGGTIPTVDLTEATSSQGKSRAPFLDLTKSLKSNPGSPACSSSYSLQSKNPLASPEATSYISAVKHIHSASDHDYFSSLEVKNDLPDMCMTSTPNLQKPTKDSKSPSFPPLVLDLSDEDLARPPSCHSVSVTPGSTKRCKRAPEQDSTDDLSNASGSGMEPDRKKSRIISPVSTAPLKPSKVSPSVTKMNLSASNQSRFFTDRAFCPSSAGRSEKQNAGSPHMDDTKNRTISHSENGVNKTRTPTSGRKLDHSTPLRERLKKSFLQNHSTHSSSGGNSLLDNTWLSAVDSSSNSVNRSSSKTGGEKKKKKKSKDSQKKSKKSAMVKCPVCQGDYPESRIAMHAAVCQIGISSDEES